MAARPDKYQPPLHVSPATGGSILIVVLDDIGIEALSVYGEGTKPAPTPNIDAFAQAGALFRYAYGNPFCSPTRATIQTGRYGFRTGIGNLVNASSWALQTSEVTLPEIVSMSGLVYENAAFGKWHLGNQSVGGSRAPNKAGWTHFSGELANSYDYFSWTKTIDGNSYQTTGYLTTDQIDDAREWIKQRQGSWLCYLGVTAAHTPLHAPPSHLHSFALPNSAPAAGEDPLPYFHAMIEALDTELGRLLAVVDPLQTHVILVGDNGSSDATITPPFTTAQNKGSVYEGGTRVPLIVRSPLVARPGSQVTAMVNTTDILATVAHMAGFDQKQLPLPKNDSVSLVPYLRHPDRQPLRNYAFSENFKPPGFGPYTVDKRALRNRRYKLIVEASQPDELYDLVLDPYETSPLPLGALKPQEQAAHAELTQALAALLAS